MKHGHGKYAWSNDATYDGQYSGACGEHLPPALPPTPPSPPSTPPMQPTALRLMEHESCAVEPPATANHSWCETAALMGFCSTGHHSSPTMFRFINLYCPESCKRAGYEADVNQICFGPGADHDQVNAIELEFHTYHSCLVLRTLGAGARFSLLVAPARYMALYKATQTVWGA